MKDTQPRHELNELARPNDGHACTTRSKNMFTKGISN